MEVAKVFTKIKELGHINSKREDLREYCKLKLDQIIKFLPRRILNADGADLLDCILNGLPDQPITAPKSKVKVVDVVLQVMCKESTSLTLSGDVISRLCLDLVRLPVEDLVRWCSDSIQSIVEDSDVNMIWKDILPECLNGISSHDKVSHCGTAMTPTEFKEQCVRTLCQCRWKEGQLVQLAAMFKDMQLSRSDHKQVVNKIGTYIIDVPPDTLPPLIHQLIKLCKSYDLEVVLAQLSHYFNVRLYSKLEPSPQDSESTTMDIDDIVPYSSEELSRCLSTCIYHISSGAAEPELIRKHLKLWPRTQLLRSPFLIDLALALSDKGSDFRSTCLDIIRSSIEQRISDKAQIAESAWARAALPPDVEVATVLKHITTESSNHRQLTVLGLINLAFALLGVSKTKSTATKCHSHGSLILVRLCKAQPETATQILSMLADRLADDSANNRQYADCLYVLCKLTPFSVERCPQISTILENCQPSPADYRPCAAVLDAIHPLLQFSTRVRDTLVMMCRKGLYSRDSLHRRLALSGFLVLLRHVSLPRSVTSQPSSDHYSAHSYLSQLPTDLHATQQGPVTSRVRNEAMCMEVVSILRRCLVQDAAVKQLLYSKIYECSKEKQILHESILELLYEHLVKFQSEDDGGATLLMDKCVQVTSVTAVLVEPIAHLLYGIAQFLQPLEEEESDDILGSQGGSQGEGAGRLRGKLLARVEAVSDAYTSRIEAEELPPLTDLTPESKAAALKVQQTLLCHETLMAYQIMMWNKDSINAAQTVYKLFKSYNGLLDQTKLQPKASKKKSNLNETRESTKSQRSQKAQKNAAAKGKGPATLNNLVKDRAGPFKPLPCVWDLSFCLRVVQLLYSEELPWSDIEQRNYIRSKRDFHQFSLRCLQAVLSTEYLDKRSVARYTVQIAAILYSRCLCRFQDMCDFDETTALGCVDLLKDCITLLFSTQYNFKMDSFLPNITGSSQTSTSSCMAAILRQVHVALTSLEPAPEAEQDALSKKIAVSLSQLAAVLLERPVDSCADYTNASLQLDSYVRSCRVDSGVLVTSLLRASCRDRQDSPLLDDLLLKLHHALGRIDEEDTSTGPDTEHFPFIDDRTGHSVLSLVCTHVIARIQHVHTLLTRVKHLQDAVKSNIVLENGREHNELKELNKSILMQLCQLTTWSIKASKLRCAIGACSERVLATCVRLYAALAAWAAGLSGADVPELRLDRLLKLCGKKLSSATDNLITYIEASQGRGQGAHKVLRDTKLIPRLVLNSEMFTRHVMLLAAKAKVNLQQYLSLGTARDFRIKAPLLQEALQPRDRPDETRNEETTNINDAETTVLSLAASDSDEENQQPAGAKRRRVS